MAGNQNSGRYPTMPGGKTTAFYLFESDRHRLKYLKDKLQMRSMSDVIRHIIYLPEVFTSDSMPSRER